ncbi:MAG TPA: hypothetical protein DCY86_13760 [Bdellovibrionales bacterium]|nr:hypothetical protein [Bdellovibrionales bacterium]
MGEKGLYNKLSLYNWNRCLVLSSCSLEPEHEGRPAPRVTWIIPHNHILRNCSHIGRRKSYIIGTGGTGLKDKTPWAACSSGHRKKFSSSLKIELIYSHFFGANIFYTVALNFFCANKRISIDG